MINLKDYRPAGPVMKAFHESTAFFRVMAGPVGSGKTGGAGCVEMLFGVMAQKPMPDGVRRAKFGVLRDTYRNLYSQFIPSWFEWFPRELGDFVGSDDRPAFHKFPLDTPMGPCELEIEMRALGANSVEKTCRGWNLTGCFLDEADLLPEQAFDFLAGRVMRWPHKDFRVSKGVWATFNKPDVDHYLYRRCVEDVSEDWAFFDQPPGLIPGTMDTNPQAENLPRLDDDYYQKQARNNPPAYVQRMVRNEWGASTSGEVIYPEFDVKRHMSATPLEPEPGDELTIGVDGGGTPAAVIGGRLRDGRRVIYAEVVLVDPYDPKGRRLLYGVGWRRFYEAVRDVIHPRFARQRFTMAWGDPSAFYGVDREYGEYSDLEKAFRELNIPLVPAESNAIQLRHDAVRGLLATQAGRREAGLIIDPRCTWLRRGFTTDYRWEERDPKQETKTLKPKKTATSHVHDAAQYWGLGELGSAGVQNIRHAIGRPPVPDGFRETSGGLIVPEGPGRSGRGSSYGQGGPGELYRSDWSPWD